MTEKWCSFRKGCSSLHATFTVQRTSGKRKEYNLLLFLIFVHYKKAYDNVIRDILWEIVENKFPKILLKNKIYL
jgi:hypothetical protein